MSYFITKIYIKFYINLIKSYIEINNKINDYNFSIYITFINATISKN